MKTVTVTDLMLNFAEACRALVPTLDRVGVLWRDGEQYDNFDRIVEPLFESLVTEPCAFQAVGDAGIGQLRTARYGFASAPDCNAWVALATDHSARVINLLSATVPFGHAQCEGRTGLVPLTKARFVFVYDAGDGAKLLESVDLGAA